MDRDKVINYLESEIKRAEQSVNDTWLECVEVKLLRDVLALLKEQEAKRPVVRKKNGYWDYVCPICGSRDEELFHEWKYCPYCGQEVKWE